VAPIVDQPDHMRHTYHCSDCGKDLVFEVMKKGVG
jgi:hypothetical protein